MSEFDQAISEGQNTAGSVATMQSNRKQENRADFVRVLLALGLLALMSALDGTRPSAEQPVAQIESATR